MVRINHFGVNRTSKPTIWHVEGLIPVGINIAAGQPGSAKSIFAEYVSFATAYEQPCLGLPTRYGPVLYINNDHPEDRHNLWLQRFCEGAFIGYNPVHPLETVHHQWSNIEKAQIEIEGILSQLKPVLMVMDRLATTLGSDENKAHNVEPFGQLLHQWADFYSMTIMCIHHFIKEQTHMDLNWMESTFGKRIRGSGSILGMTDSAMELVTTEKDSTGLKEFGVRPHGKRYVLIQPFRVGMKENGQAVTLEFRQVWQPVDPELQGLANEILPLFDMGQELTVNEVFTNFAGAYDLIKIREALKYLDEDKKLLMHDRKQRGGKYFYKKLV